MWGRVSSGAPKAEDILFLMGVPLALVGLMSSMKDGPGTGSVMATVLGGLGIAAGVGAFGDVSKQVKSLQFANRLKGMFGA